MKRRLISIGVTMVGVSPIPLLHAYSPLWALRVSIGIIGGMVIAGVFHLGRVFERGY